MVATRTIPANTATGWTESAARSGPDYAHLYSE
jgi:hypothetical protein